MPTVNMSVPGRDIMASGSLVLESGQGLVRFTLDDLPLDIVFVEGGGEASVRSETLGNGVRLHLTGFNNPLGTAYSMPSLATIDGKTISMVILVHAIATPGTASPEPPVRMISYSAFGSPSAA